MTKTIKLLNDIYGNEGGYAELLYNGKRIRRKIYYRSDCGLYIRINNKRYFEYDFRYTDEIEEV